MKNLFCLFLCIVSYFQLQVAWGDDEKLSAHDYWERAYQAGKAGDDKLLFDLMSKSADMGYLPAQRDLGTLYQTGQGVSQNFDKAKSLFQEAADKGDSEANVRLGYMYMLGNTSFEKDIDKALAFFNRAAAKGNVNAQHNLALLYSKEEGRIDGALAYIWAYVAVRSGDKESQRLKEAWEEHIKAKSPSYLKELQETAEDIYQKIQSAMR